VINGHAFIPAGSSETFSLLVAVVPFAEQVGLKGTPFLAHQF
jgi:hypothetical protein